MTTKKLSDQEEDFVYAALQEDPSRWGRYVIYLVLIMVALGLTWAAYFELDEVATANGKVIPAGRGQVVQVFETGILKELNVQEGDLVNKGQVLLLLDDTRAGPVCREATKKWQALSGRAARLRSEAYSMPLVFPAEILDEDELIKIETQAYRARRDALEEQMQALLLQQKALLREVELTEPLVKQGVVSEVEVLRLKRQAAEIQGQISQLQTNFLSKSSDELAQVEAELGQIAETLVGYREALDRTTVYSPTDGIVQDLSVRTIGAIVNSGQTIMAIVPTNDDLLVEAFMPPTEVAFVAVGDLAKVKLSAFDDRRFGSLDGVVEFVSPDVMIEDSKSGRASEATPVNFEPGFYKLLIRITNPGIERQGMTLNPKVGMTATVDILTGKKTVLDYIFRPVQAVKEALRER